MRRLWPWPEDALYERLTASLLPVAKSKRTRRGGEGKIRP
jgi:hypothetical protein